MVADVVFERLFRFGTNTPVPPDTVDALFSKPLSTSRDLGSALSGSNPSSTLSARLSVRRSVHPSGLERRKIIARCRVLRADIRQFEEDFEKRLGRKPHGVERQQKHHVYMEYRQLKGVIRGACACLHAVERGRVCACVYQRIVCHCHSHHLLAENAVLHIQAVWRGCAARRRVAAETGGMLPRPRATKREVASSSKQGSPRVPALSSPSLSQPGASSTLTSPTLPVAGAMSYAFAASSSNTAAAGTSAPSKPSVAVVSSTTPSASVAAAAASAPSAHGPLVPPRPEGGAARV
ncbi:hypothetical protein EON62_01450 [archaeon]|nr:MAG: hypothetical protein EON62_01450 [archaeon]